MTGFHHHKDGDAEEEGLKQVVDTYKMIRKRQRQRPDHPADNQPRCKQIEPLEGMKPDHIVAPELAGRKHDYGGNPPDRGDVAED